MTHPDVPAEQAHVDYAYQRLDAMRAAATAMLSDAFGERGGTFQAVTERDIRVRSSLGRLDQLQLGRESLVFGRIDQSDPTPGGAGTEVFHIGRLAISDVDQEPLVVDWRAPVAEPFYRATGHHPMGLRRRRHFLTDGPRVVDLEDELFDAEGDHGGASLGLSGSQVLLAALERSRSGRMRDIVATVQREQDEIIRGPLGGILVVQGGPGTGKTAVALHRAAYLLYTHRFPLERQGVLVVGPNPTFLRYIEHVLPSLGESGVELSTINGLFAEVRPSGRDNEVTARLKGDARMARVLARAVGDRQRPLRRTAEIPYGRSVLRVTPRLSARVVAAAKRRPGTHNGRRRLVENLLWQALLGQASLGQAGARQAGGGERTEGEPLGAEELGRSLRHQPETVEVLARMWPVLAPQELLRDLFGAPALIELSARGLLSPAEQQLLVRQRGPLGAPVAWTEGDIALLDEARAQLGPSRRRSGAPRDESPRTYGHVVVDEAQDLSPMQLRMLGRRCLSGSMTVVGDIAQAMGPWAPTSWGQVIEHLPARRGWRLVELTVNYRTPAEIMDMAGRLLERVAPGVRPPESVRTSGLRPRVVTAAAGAFPGEALPALAVRAVLDELGRAAPDATVGVISAPSLLDGVGRALDAAGLVIGRVGDRALDELVTLLSVGDAKGLEFDSVVVVEPARLASEVAQGLQALYVAFTRATHDLVVVHSEPLPEVLLDSAQSSA